MKRTLVFCLAATLLLSTAHRAPAPISEVETPTPAPKPKPKRTIKPKASESSESSIKRPTSSPTPNRNPFGGTWSAFLTGSDDYRTLVINAGGTVVTEKSTKWGTFTWMATCDSVSMRWKSGGGCSWNFTPNPDGKTGLTTMTCSGFLGIGAGNWSATFHKTSPN